MAYDPQISKTSENRGIVYDGLLKCSISHLCWGDGTDAMVAEILTGMVLTVYFGGLLEVSRRSEMAIVAPYDLDEHSSEALRGSVS